MKTHSHSLSQSLALSLAMCSMALAAEAGDFKLISPDIAPGGSIANKFIYKGFGCSGDNISPALQWSGASAGTQSFALLVHDADAPTRGAGSWPCVVHDIPDIAAAVAEPAGTAEAAGLP